MSRRSASGSDLAESVDRLSDTVKGSSQDILGKTRPPSDVL